MPKLSQILADAPTKRPLNHPCGIAVLLADIAKKDGKAEADAVNQRLIDMKYHATVLSELLRNNGFDIHHNTIRRHRKGECSCSVKR